MSKRTRARKHLPHATSQAGKEKISSDATLERGWNAFITARFDEAIKIWERVVPQRPTVAPALAEAYLRHALTPATPPAQQILDLQRATALVPNDALYHYHLGLMHHRGGDLDKALVTYEIVATLNPQLRGFGFTFALAKLENDPNVDVSASTGLSDLEREIIEMLARLLRGDALPKRVSDSWLKTLVSKFNGADNTLALWRGLGQLLVNEDAAAQETLNAATRLTLHGETLKRYYLGVIAARRNDWSAATLAWQQAQARGLATPWVRENLAAVHLPNAITAAQSGNWQAALEHARAALRADTASKDASQIAVLALDRLARAAADMGKWAQAAAHWNEASQLAPNLNSADGTARLVWQNLAIASEMSEAWAQAATAWRELLRLKPRGKKKDRFTDAHWNWIRQRATQDLQKAGRLGEAIALMKQKLKSTPKDLPARMELVDALLANQQESAARNELQRILEIDGQYRAARVKLAEVHAARHEWFAAETEMRIVLDQDPANETVRKQIAILMMERGRMFHADGRVALARDVFEQALKYAPTHADIYIDLGRADLDMQQDDRARQDFELAYNHGAKQIGTHEQIVACWALTRNLAEVKKAVARAEREIEPHPLFFVHAGLSCLQYGAVPLGRFAPPTMADQEWERFGKELVDRGVALKPNDVELLRHVAMDFAEAQSRFGLPYVERLTQLTPDDADAWLMLAMFQLTSQQLNQAKNSFHQTARLARKQGKRELEQVAEQMRRELNNPMLSMALNLGLPLGDLFGGMDGEDDFADEDFDLFPMPRRKKRRR